MSLDELTRRIERLEATEAIRALLARYAAACDQREAAGLSELFTSDAVLRSVSEYDGRTAILEYYDSVLSSLISARHHVINSTIELETRDRARHRAYFLAFLIRQEGAVAVFGDYDDVVVRGHDGAWRFSEKGNRGAGSIELSAGGSTVADAPLIDEER